MSITFEEYYTELKDITECLIEEEVEYLQGDHMNVPTDILKLAILEDVDLYGLADSEVEEHKWVNESKYHMDVITHTNNVLSIWDKYSDTALENILENSGTSGLRAVTVYSAMLQDVHDEIVTQLEGL